MFSKSKPFNYYVNVNLFISTTINDFHCAIESAKVDSISRGPSAQHKDTESSITFKWRFRFNDFTARKSAVRKLQSDYNRSWKCYTQLVFVSIVLENTHTHTQFAVVKRFRELNIFFWFCVPTRVNRKSNASPNKDCCKFIVSNQKKRRGKHTQNIIQYHWTHKKSQTWQRFSIICVALTHVIFSVSLFFFVYFDSSLRFWSLMSATHINNAFKWKIYSWKTKQKTHGSKPREREREKNY